MLIVTLLIVPGLVMTQGMDLVENLLVEPLHEQLYVFDVTTDAQLSDVTAALDGVTVRHCIKIFGQSRYFIVVASNSSEALRDLSFPGESVVTQNPIQYLGEFFQMFGVTTGYGHDFDSRELFGDNYVTILSWELVLPVEMSVREYRAVIRRIANRFLQLHSAAKPVTYAFLSSYPPRFYTLVDMEDNSVQNVGLDSLSNLGGPGRVLNRAVKGMEV